ncbi:MULTISPECIES: HNH endonuclease [Mycolicibacterium]|uniref:HNH endonuclease n=1 Tax=Mycolicibacterium mucogenicum TaxID=56689 RepID=A0A4R5WIY2_MYCMU|nr:MULTISPECIES: HNH endonuclease [Mycolicibacterium]TDK89511.1 HNH endonuclease [Mycolicibacterium mucogenicum]BBZ54076.1 HNH endonuclease [Mycolicibacterium phocaicum]
MSEALVDPDAGEAASLGRMAELERVKARAAAEQARIAVALEARRVAAAKTGGPRVSRAALGSEIGLARRESPHRGERLMAMARILVADMPCTLAALESGVLSEHRAELITKEAACLSVLDRRLLDAELCGDPGPLAGLGNAEVSAEAARIAYELDQQTVVEKMRRARSARHVRFRVAADGMMSMTVLMPAAQGQLVRQTLAREAASAVAAGSERSRAQVMADVVVERVTGRDPVTTPVPVTLNLVMSDETLLTGGEQPAQLDGYGPIPAVLARDLVLAAAADATVGAALRRLYAQPGTNKLVAMESKARAFPKALATFIGLRDQICRTPYCNARIRHTDHVTPHAKRGPTSSHNGDGLCEHCNYVKEEPGWQAAASYDRYGRHTIALTTPSGAVYTSTAPPTPDGLRIFTRDVHIARINPAA